jgi:hypothetical protein
VASLNSTYYSYLCQISITQRHQYLCLIWWRPWININRQRMCSTADRSGAYTSKHYLCSLIAQATEYNVSVHVRNTCWVRVPTSACIFQIVFYLFLCACCARMNTHLNCPCILNEYLCKHNVGKNEIWDSTFCRRQKANDRKMTISAFGTLLA